MKCDYIELVKSIIKERNISVEEIKGIDPDLLDKTVPNPDGGTYSSYTWLRRSEKFRKICLGKGGNDDKGYGYTGTISPYLKYDLPIFAYDIRKIRGRILIVLDIKPVLRTPEYITKYVEPIKAIYDVYKDLIVKPLKATWTAPYRSGYGMPCMTGLENEERVKECFLAYLNLFLDYAEKAFPVSSETQLEIQKYVDDYTAVYKEKDPGAAHSIKLFGKKWAEEHLDILF